MFQQKTGFETQHLSESFDKKSWYYEKNKTNLLLTNPELFIIYWKFDHLFWYHFLELQLNCFFFFFFFKWNPWINSFYLGRGFCRSNFKIKIRIPSSFILTLYWRKFEKTNKCWISKLDFKIEFDLGGKGGRDQT